jgi:hypothetical protein
MDIDPDQVLRSPGVAGGFGAIVGLAFAPGASWRERAFNVLAGGLSAYYIAPALTEWLRIEPAGIRACAAFGVGLFGLSVASEVVKFIRDGGLRRFADTWLQRKG